MNNQKTMKIHDDFIPLSMVEDVREMDAASRQLLQLCDGFHTVREIKTQYGDCLKRVGEMHDHGHLVFLHDWCKLKWCLHCDLPLEEGICPICGRSTLNVALSPPCDPRPAFPVDYAHLASATTDDDLLKNRILKANAVLMSPYMPRPDLLHSGKDWPSAVIVHGRHVADLNYCDGKWGLSAKVSGTEVVDHGGPGWGQVIQANRGRIEKSKEAATKAIMEGKERFPTLPLVCFSGGKDGLLLLDLVSRTLLPHEYNLLYIDTGCEHPELREYVPEITKSYGTKNFFIHPVKRDFFKCWEEFGPLTIENKWCTHHLKIVPLEQIRHTLYQDQEFLTMFGERRQEGLGRRFASPFNAKTTWFDGVEEVTQRNIGNPVYSWTQFQLWLYFWDQKVPYSSIYDRGFERLVCFVCPGRNRYERDMVRSEYSKEYQLFREKLPGLDFES